MPKKTTTTKPKKPKASSINITIKGKRPTKKVMKIEIKPKVRGGLKKSEKVAGKRMA